MSFSVNFIQGQPQVIPIDSALQPLQIKTARFGCSLMPATTTDRFADVWWRLYLNIDGGMLIHGPGASLSLAANRLAILPAWIQWQLTCKRPTRHIFIEIECPQFTGQQLKSTFDRALVLKKEHSSLLIEYMPRIQAGPIQTESGNLLLAGIHQAMAHVSPYLQSLQPTHPLLDEICQFIEAHLNSDLRIPGLAERFLCSPKHITNLFNQYLQQSPAAYIRDRRLALACNLLRESDDSIEQIAEQAGFANRAYMSRIMSKHMHIAPAAYRKRVN